MIANSPTEQWLATVVKVRCGRIRRAVGNDSTSVKTVFQLQKKVIMEDSLSQYAARFAAASLTSLVDSFNSQVGNRGWTSARACHDTALIEEFKRRGIDVSSVSHGDSISFAHHVQLAGNRLVIID